MEVSIILEVQTTGQLTVTFYPVVGISFNSVETKLTKSTFSHEIHKNKIM